MVQTEEASPSSSERVGPTALVVIAGAAVAFFAVCLLIAVRYPNVPRTTAPPIMVTDLFGRRLAIAALGSLVVLGAGTFVVARRPPRVAVRILMFGLPLGSLLAAIAMPVATVCGPGMLPRDGTCHSIGFAILEVHGRTSLEIPARLAICALGCLGGLYFWILARHLPSRRRPDRRGS